ncbi:MAG: adenosylhomocysteinase [Deferribacteraceae bacterium]|jgi:adenosylhomocysteinase|nr:adenosylhomocysteinase [Deferribacteraceae bacterium]
MFKIDIKDKALAPKGKKRILWADKDMPVLAKIRERFAKEKPFEGYRISCCLHVTAETANLMRTLVAGGGDAVLVASNPLSTQDDAAASLVEDFGVPVSAIRGENNDQYYSHIKSAIEHSPHITMDDGADLVSEILKNHPSLHKQIICSMEETTTGVIRLKAMQESGVLKFPIIAVNDVRTKHLFDNRYGTGQSTIDGIIRATDILLAGKTFVIAGYGWCGRGLSERARGLGANVIVTEVDPIKALEAIMNGFRVMPMDKAAAVADVICTVTGDINVIDSRHFPLIKDGCYICNSGHFDVEINLKALAKEAIEYEKEVRGNVDAYRFSSGKVIYVLGEGRLINLAAAEGHPASVMDMSFATQALATEYAVKNRGKLENLVHLLPRSIELDIANTKLATMGFEIDQLTAEQERYLSSWESGT